MYEGLSLTSSKREINFGYFLNDVLIIVWVLQKKIQNLYRYTCHEDANPQHV